MLHFTPKVLESTHLLASLDLMTQPNAQKSPAMLQNTKTHINKNQQKLASTKFNKNKHEKWKGNNNLVGGYRSPFFCETYKRNLTRFDNKVFRFDFERSLIDNVMSIFLYHLQELKAFLAHPLNVDFVTTTCPHILKLYKVKITKS
jgi:hypothetical protein